MIKNAAQTSQISYNKDAEEIEFLEDCELFISAGFWNQARQAYISNDIGIAVSVLRIH